MKKSPFSSPSASVPHLSSPPGVQSLPSFIIKNTPLSSGVSDNIWCRTRVVLLQQTHGARTILYDSKKMMMKAYPGAHDEKVLGDLVFGSAPFYGISIGDQLSRSRTLRKISTKVHYISQHGQTIVSKLFHLRIPRPQLSDVLSSGGSSSQSSLDSSSSSFSDSDDGYLSGSDDQKSRFLKNCTCFECKPLFALVVIFSVNIQNVSKSSNSKTVSKSNLDPKLKKNLPSGSSARRARVRANSAGERIDSQQEMVNEKRKMIELQAFLFCSLSVLMNQVEYLHEEVCKSLRKTIVQVMKKWKKKKKRSILDLISTNLSFSKSKKKLEEEEEEIEKKEKESTKSEEDCDACGNICELNLKLSAFILDHDPLFLSQCKHFEQHISTYLHAQKSACYDSVSEGGRTVPGGHGFFSRGGGLWQKVLVSGSATSPKGYMPRTTWKNDGKEYGDPLSKNSTISSLKGIWEQLEEDIKKLIHYVSKRKLLQMGWKQEKSAVSERKKKDKPQQPVERRIVLLTKRFLCSVLTSVFSHHSGWIFPFIRDGNRINARDQLESIYGGKGSANGKDCTKYCKILVVGNDYKIVRQLLVVLSFFIRCNPYLIKQYSVNPNHQSLASALNTQENEPASTITRGKSSKTTKSPDKKQQLPRQVEDKEMILKLYEILPIQSLPDNEKKSKPIVKNSNDRTQEVVGDSMFLNFTPIISRSMYFTHHLSIPFGESLVFSEINSKYCPIYVLSALPKSTDYFEGTIQSLRLDLEKNENVDSSYCIVIDMNDLMCNIVMAKRSETKKSSDKKSSVSIKKKKISIDFQESICSPFVLELFNNMLEIFLLKSELKNSHLLLNNFFNQKLKEAIILAELAIDWIEKDRNLQKRLFLQKKKRKQVNLKIENIEIEVENEEKFLYEIEESRICKELNIPSSDFCITKNIVGYLRPDILRCMKSK